MDKIVLCLVLYVMSMTAFANTYLPAPLNKLKFSGYLDGSFNYLVRSNRFISGSFDRVYDLEPNGFTLQQAALTVSDQPREGLGGLINIIAGRDANSIAPYGWDPYFGSQTLAFNPTQAYLQYARGPFTAMGGILLATTGAEVIDPTQDVNFSRSILDGYTEPFTLMGIRLAYLVSDHLNVFVGLNNGWDSIRDISRRKTLEGGITYKPNDKWSIATVILSGGQRAQDRTSSGPESIRDLYDIVITFNATDQLTLIINYDYGNQTIAALPNAEMAEASWQGMAGYANYQFNEKWRGSIRGEIFSDRNGYRTGVVQCWKELTLSLGYVLVKNLELRAEARHDFSNANAFVNGNGKGANSNQQSYALEAFYKFV